MMPLDMRSDNDIELAKRARHLPSNSSRGHTSTSSTSQFDRARLHAADDFTGVKGYSDDQQPDSRLRTLTGPSFAILSIIRLLSYHKIQVFPAGSIITQYDKSHLGEGVMFHVEASSLPIWRSKQHLQYRDPTFPIDRTLFNFTDHTGNKWNHTTFGAYKVLKRESGIDQDKRDRLLHDLLQELRILSHPPLQVHQNIVHMLGFAWIPGNRFFEHNYKSNTADDDQNFQEWPTIVTEKAPHESLATFRMSHPNRKVRPSLRGKLILCAQVLNGLKVVHDCGIVHCDVKCANVLVYETKDGNQENWLAKLSDFGNSIILEECAPIREQTANSILRGTKRYNPPEVTSKIPLDSLESLKFADMWAFGLLVWEVMLDDTDTSPFLDTFLSRRKFNFDQSRETLLTYCVQHLEERYSEEPGLIDIAKNLVFSCLRESPKDRPTAEELLDYLRDAMPLDKHITKSTSRAQEKPELLDSLPFFHLVDHYYDLQALLTIPRQIYTMLDSFAGDWPLEKNQNHVNYNDRRHVEVQLALCHASGFGTKPDRSKAIEHLTAAARYGDDEAQVLLPRLYVGLGTQIPESRFPDICSWLAEACRNGSLTALHDLQALDASALSHMIAPESIQMIPLGAMSRQPVHLPPLHSAILNHRSWAQDLDNVNQRDEYGVVPLHYTIALPEPEGMETARTLLLHGADMFAKCSQAFTFSQNNFILNKVEMGANPIHTVIKYDRVALFKVFLESFGNQTDIKQLWNVSDGVVWLAVRYSSVQCLQYLCTEARWSRHVKKHADDLDKYQFTAMYYACRPSYFDELFHSAPASRSGDVTEETAPSPMVAKKLRIIKQLLAVGYELKMNKDETFGVLHLLASFGQPEILKGLLEIDKAALLVNQRSWAGWTPLKDAISRDRKESFHALISCHASIKNIWDIDGFKDCHALHVCALHPGPAAVEFASWILEKDPKSIHVRDSQMNTPLHAAAQFGNVRFASLLTRHHRASLFATNQFGRTPLGVAILYRESAIVNLLRDLCSEKSIPEVSMVSRFALFGSLRVRTVAPVEDIVTPGPNPTTIKLVLPFEKFGAADHPFSTSSEILLKELLKTHPQPTKFGTNFIQNAICSPVLTSGLYAAINMANHKGAEMILSHLSRTSDLPKSHLRFLLFRALDLLPLNEFNDFATRSARTKVVETVWERCKSEFTEKQEKRFKSRLLAPMWKLYYRVYGNRENDHLSRTKAWIEGNLRFATPRQIGHASYLSGGDVLRLHGTRFSLTQVNLLLVILLDIPTIIIFTILSRRFPGLWKPEYAALATICVALTIVLAAWSRMFRAFLVVHDMLQDHYDPQSGKRTMMEVSFLIFLLALCNLNLYAFYRGARIWPYYVTENEEPQVMAQRELASHYWSLCSALIAWHVITIDLPVVVRIYFMLGRVRGSRAAR